MADNHEERLRAELRALAENARKLRDELNRPRPQVWRRPAERARQRDAVAHERPRKVRGD